MDVAKDGQDMEDGSLLVFDGIVHQALIKTEVPDDELENIEDNNETMDIKEEPDERDEPDSVKRRVSSRKLSLQ